jgi:hypothetical protein
MRLILSPSMRSYLMIFALAFGITFAIAQPVTAHDWGFRFYSTSANVENRTSSYGTAVQHAVNNYDANTDLTVRLATPSVIIYLQGNWGNTWWDAGTVPYSRSRPCVSWPSLTLTGTCDKTNNKADFAYIYFNDYKGAFNMPEYGTRHEMGHVFGQSHAFCLQPPGDNTWSVMREGGCRPNVPTSLTAHDIADFNSWY